MRKNNILLLALLIMTTAGRAQVTSDGLKLYYPFQNGSGNTVSDASGSGYDATLMNSARTETLGDRGMLSLGENNGYLDMGAAVGNLIVSLEDFTVATYLYIDAGSDITGAGNFVWAFSTLEACGQTTGKYIAYRVNSQRYAQSSGGWGSETVAIQVGGAAAKGAWHHVVYTQSGTSGRIYIDGQLARLGSATLQPKSIGTPTTCNWLGRPHFSADNYLRNSYYSDFRIYDRALTATEIGEFTTALPEMEEDMIRYEVDKAKEELVLRGTDAVKGDLELISTTGKSIHISWSSSNPEVMTNEGKVTRPEKGKGNATLTLTATLSKGDYSVTKEFTVTVVAMLGEQEAIAADIAEIAPDTDRSYYLGKIKLSASGTEGSSVSWKSDKPDFLSHSGEIVRLPAKGEGVLTVTLTATVTNGSTSVEQDFPIRINEEEGYAGYLFAYFTGNAASQEQIFFGLSPDGYNYYALNGGNPVISGAAISAKGGVRDPHILRGDDGKFYMVVTDMKTSEANCNWACNYGIVLLKSDDLVNWTHSKVDLRAKYPSEFGDVTRAWAPQVIYDAEKGKYMVYFSIKTSRAGSYDIIHYAYVNDTFTDLETAPRQLFFHPNKKSCIDGDIICKDGKYHLFFKTEGDGNGIKKAVSDKLTEGYVLEDRYLQQTNDAVEGSCVFRFINQDKYILMYDVYSSGRYEFTESTDLNNFVASSRPVSTDFAPRHGTVIPITKGEAEALVEKWGSSAPVTFGTAISPAVKAINIVVNETAKTVYLPVKEGTDLTHFDPQISGKIPGIKVDPETPQDFSGGAITYTLSKGSASGSYAVSAAINNNPVISSGYYADPDILYSEKTGRFYIYPTTDGFSGWGGYYFKVFSSDNLVHWTDEGVIIDMKSDQVKWANGNAWAPCIIEKKINGEYKYFYYFSGGMNGGAKKIGVAVADHPTGPFTVSTEALLTSSPTGSGQQIDPDVFTDPVSGKSYLYWGNGYLAGAELNDDMVSLKSSPKVMTPSYFTEAVYVFYRNGKYYFMWSHGNTNDKSYKVYYGTSNSPLGTISIPSNNNILIYDDATAIYGPGHNSVLQIPGKDEWYIVYHRISRPKGITQSSPGNFREVCIDKLEFNEDGTIKKVIPTLEGISPVNLNLSGIATITANEGEVKVYPTLVKDFISIQPENGEEGMEVSLLDISGRIVKRGHLPAGTTRVDCSSLSKGWYLLTVKLGDRIYTEKISKI